MSLKWILFLYALLKLDLKDKLFIVFSQTFNGVS